MRILVDCTDHERPGHGTPPHARALMDRHGVNGFPTVLFLDPRGARGGALCSREPAEVVRQLLETARRLSEPEALRDDADRAVALVDRIARGELGEPPPGLSVVREVAARLARGERAPAADVERAASVVAALERRALQTPIAALELPGWLAELEATRRAVLLAGVELPNPKEDVP